MYAIFDEIIQLLLRSKVAKAESCLIGGYHDERIELTYYIETLVLALAKYVHSLMVQMILHTKPQKIKLLYFPAYVFPSTIQLGQSGFLV